MNSNDPKKHQKQRWRVRINHTIGVVLVILISLVFFQLLRGRAIDINSGQVITNGLVVIDSSPSGAEIYINGDPEGSDTKKKANLPQGPHTVELISDGYHKWRKRIEVVPSEVTNLSYVKLMKTNPKWSKIAFRAGFEPVSSLTKENKMVVLSSDGQLAQIDLGRDDFRVTYDQVFQPSQAPESEVTYNELLDYDGDKILIDASRTAIPTDNADGGSGLKSVVYLKDFGSNNLPGEFEFSDQPVDMVQPPQFMGDYKKLIYLQKSGVLRVVSTEGDTQSVRTMYGVKDFDLAQSGNVTLLRNIDAEATSGSSGQSAESDESSDADSSTSLSLQVYDFNDDELVGSLATIADADNVEFVAAGGEDYGEYVAMVHGGYQTFYDIEDLSDSSLPPEPLLYSKTSATSLQANGDAVLSLSGASKPEVHWRKGNGIEYVQFSAASASDNVASWGWLDGDHLAAYSEKDQGGQVVSIADFDGANMIDLAPAAGGRVAGLDFSVDWHRAVRTIDDDGAITIEKFINHK